MKNTQTKSKLLSTVLPTLILISGLYIAQYTNQAHAFCDETSSFLDRACKTVQDTWTQGEHSVYLPLHTYHLRSAYTPEKINSFNENTFGIGYGRTAFDENGHQDEVYAMAFHESHNKPEYIAGYAHQWLLGKPTELHAGAGYTVFLTSRTDILRYTPIPGILPIASVGYGKASLNTTFVPGTQGNGNIFFIWSKFDFN